MVSALLRAPVGALSLLVCLAVLPATATRAQVSLPQVVVSGTKPKPKLHQEKRPPAALHPTNAAAAKNNEFNAARKNLYTTIGTTSDTMSHDTIQALPQGTNEPVEKVLLQAPGVSQDSAASGSLHVRNDHANMQYRINGVMLPDGVTGFSTLLDTGMIGSMSLINGALPAEFGLRTVGLIDITTRNDIFNNSGSVGTYGGSRGTIEPSLEYGGTAGNTCPTAKSAGAAASAWADCFPGVQYFFTGRYLQTTEGIENLLPTLNAIHDSSQQARGFGYMSAFIDPATRLSLITGTSTSWFHIPNVPGAPLFPGISSAYGVSSFDSSKLNENQYEDTQYSVLALQRSVGGFDGQLSYFTRYDYLHYMPDSVGDLLINGISSNVTRESFTNGIQGDGSFVINDAHTLRTGFTISGEQSAVGNQSTVEPCNPGGCPNYADMPTTYTDNVSKVGWLAGVYAQDEWKLTDKLTMNYGLRFDQMWQYVDANQLSPRINFTYKPFALTTFHAGYARYFTPPVLVEAAPDNLVNNASFNNSSGATSVTQASPVLPERSNYFDAGVDQKIPFGCTSTTDPDCSMLDLGIDAYYKQARDLIDNGTFSQALVLSAFNYAKGIVKGIEFKAKYRSGNFQAYGNIAVGYEKATDVVSNQYLFDNTTPQPDLGGMTELQYIDSHWIYTDHTQIVTGSAGMSYLWNGTRYSADLIYGSGLRDGDANISHVPGYTQVNVGASREFMVPNYGKFTARLVVVNVFDSVYLIRDGSGIGVFAPQYGPRRSYFVGLSKAL